MHVWILLLGLVISFGSNSIAQTYKYVGREGTICFTDTPPASKSGTSSKKSNEAIKQAKKGRTEIKDILQMAQEMLDEELAKPPKSQNQKLIRELNEVLYGDVSGMKAKSSAK